MRAARWVVIGTALAAAATALYLLAEPDAGSPRKGAADGPPQDEIDAESRKAMRDFLRESARGDGAADAGGE